MALLAPVALLLVVVTAVWVLARSRPSDATSAERAAQHHIDRFSWAALVLWLLTGLASCTAIGTFGRGVLVAPAIAGAVAMVVLAIGERTVPLEKSQRNLVDLTPRSEGAYVVRSTVILAVTTLGTLFAILTLAWITATADEFGNRGRGVSWTTQDGSQSHGPWPGSYYSLPLLAALVVLGAAFAVTMRVVTTRPQINADTRAAVADAHMRARSARTAQGLLLITLGATLSGVSLCVALATGGAQPGSPVWVTCAHWGSLAAALIGMTAIVRGVWVGVTR